MLKPVELQPGLRVTVSPDNGQGGRGGFLAIEHTNAGINLVSQGSFVNEAGVLDWAITPVATGLDPSKPHTVTLKLVKKPNTKKSTNNDVFSVQVDGKPVKNTTFEAYYKATDEQNYQTDTLLFRLSGTADVQFLKRWPADRRRHHRDLLTPAQHLPKQRRAHPVGGPSALSCAVATGERVSRIPKPSHPQSHSSSSTRQGSDSRIASAPGRSTAVSR